MAADEKGVAVGKASRKRRNRTRQRQEAMQRFSGAMVPAGPPGLRTALGVPPVGAHYANAQGLEFQVLAHTVIHDDGKRPDPSHHPGHSLERLVTKRVPIEVPVVAVGGLSERLARLLLEFDAVCPKPVVFVDTSQVGLAQRMHFGGHSINWQAHPHAAIITLDSPETTEDVIAHELMHGWLGIVEEYEDRRMYRDRSDHAAMFLVDSTQCMVLDCRAQEAIGERGFDPCFWTAAIVDCLYEDAVALAHDVYPVTAYEASFAAKLYAWPTAVPHLFRFNSGLAEKYIMARNMIREKMPEMARLGDEVARAFGEGSYRTPEEARCLIDRCLLLMADYVGMDLDVERDLVEWRPPEPKWVDKFPEMLPGMPVALKCEVTRRLIRDGWPTGTIVTTSVAPRSNVVHVAFHPPSDSPSALPISAWEWKSPQLLPLAALISLSYDPTVGTPPAARLRPRSWDLLEMGKAQTAPGGGRPGGPKTPAITEPAHLSHQPMPQVGMPPAQPQAFGTAAPNRTFHSSLDTSTIRGRRGGPTMRYYLPGLGRFISRVHLHEAVAMGMTTYEELREVWGVNIGPPGTSESFARNAVSEHPYTYCAGDPLYCIDPSGLVLHFINCNQWKRRQIRRQWNDVCQNRMRFLSRQARQCVRSRCNGDLWVECNVQSHPNCGPGGYGFTAPHRRRHIHMCEDAFHRPRGGCLGKTLLHEAIHSCKEDFAEWPPRQCEYDAYDAPGRPPCAPYT